MHFSLADATTAVTAARESGKASFSVLATRGTMVLELYAPRGIDEQTPHTQDELYFVASGSGTFFCGGERVQFAAGDALFAAAGVEDRKSVCGI